MFTRFAHWVKAVTVKMGYVVSHPQVLLSEYREEVTARVWARNVAKNK